MIPADVANSLKQPLLGQQLATDAPTRPVLPTQQIADVLSDLVPGQRILAEIQSLLPNGSYRAVVAQRDITLALPFSVKPGDTLELEVAESDGKLTLAFVANRSDAAAGKTLPESVTTSLSNAGKMIGNLLNELSADGKRAPPAPLNGNQALVETMPKVAATDLAPLLQQALTKSGMFYEAHQARWVAGELPLSALREEPQGKMATGASETRSLAANSTNSPSTLTDKTEMGLTGSQANGRSEANQPGNTIARELTPLVQQQLDALANKNYAWQGQIWPGQPLWWEISENPNESRSTGDESTKGRWQTRLKLSLPSLGGIETILHLHAGGKIDILMTADSAASEIRLQQNARGLQEHLEAAGINLSQLVVRHGETRD